MVSGEREPEWAARVDSLVEMCRTKVFGLLMDAVSAQRHSTDTRRLDTHPSSSYAKRSCLPPADNLPIDRGRDWDDPLEGCVELRHRDDHVGCVVLGILWKGGIL